MAEFKKLSEVEKLETASDNASILIEEGGEIKRVPKKEIGGAGGYVISLGNSSVEAMEYGFNCLDNYDELYNVLVAGGHVWIDTENAPEYNSPSPTSIGMQDVTNFGAPKFAVSVWQLTDVGLAVYDITGNLCILFPNGSHNLEPIQNDNPPT